MCLSGNDQPNLLRIQRTLTRRRKPVCILSLLCDTRLSAIADHSSTATARPKLSRAMLDDDDEVEDVTQQSAAVPEKSVVVTARKLEATKRKMSDATHAIESSGKRLAVLTRSAEKNS